MTRAKPLPRRAGLVLGLIALSTTAGCAHFREAHERALREQGQSAEAPAPIPSTPMPPAPFTPTPLPPAASAPASAPAAAPQPVPMPGTPPATETAQSPAKAQKAQRAAQKAEAAQDAARRKEEARARRRQDMAEAKQATATPAQPLRQPVFETPATPPPAPAPAPSAPAPVSPAPAMPAPPAPAADVPAGPVIIVFANVPGPRCGACETVKISVQPSGKVLIERGHGAEESWRYKRSLARTRPERAAAFAARLAALRPQGKRDLTCAAPSGQGQGVSVEWIEAERHDQLTIAPGCGNPALATLMQAPELLDLRQLSFPWGAPR